LLCKHIQAAGASKADIVDLWGGRKYASTDGSEWEFFLEYAASCVCDEDDLASVVENSKLEKLGYVPAWGEGYSIIERLLVATMSW